MSKRALIVWGGWEGHEPDKVAEIFRRQLAANGFEVEVSNAVESFADAEKQARQNLVVPVWTMSGDPNVNLGPLFEAVKSGVGIGGCHGGMCDSFRNNTEYQFMTGGQWVAHPGNDGVRYVVKIVDREHPITRGMQDFEVASEQYYMHVDPAVKALAVTHMPVAEGPHTPNGEFDMPVTWTKFYGQGRVFYCSLGHVASVVELPPVLEMMTRGLLWAAR